jgi:hypothetical protein
VIRVSVVALVVTGVAIGGGLSPALAQGWAVDVSAGRLVYDPISATVGTSNLIGSVRYDGSRDTWIYGAAALPVGDAATFWGAGGIGGRLMRTSPSDGPTSVGADLGAHVFSFRDRLVSLTGSGGTVEAFPFVRVALGDVFVEGGAGWRGHTLSFAGLRENRAVIETGIRGGYGYGDALRVEGDARWVHANEGTYPFVGATVTHQASRIGVWGQLGKWLAVDLPDRVWALGTDVALRPGTSVWGSVRREAPDPLYWNASRRTWSVGLTQQLGRVPTPLVPIPRAQPGVVFVRLPAAEAPAGAVSIAGDFNNWQPAPMRREGSDWVARLPLSAGVYHYAFRTAGGEWFVPPSTPGRRPDGMGGYHALLVVG